MGLPPVVAGLIVTMMLWRNGPLGGLELLYTPAAMIIAQAVIAIPIVAGLTAAALNGLDPRYRVQLRSLGAGPLRETWLLLREARVGMLAAVVAGFGAVISEVGAAMMVGGNIKGQTRVLTTATVLEVNRGNFETAVALSFVLLVVVYGVALLLTIAQGRRQDA
jgi:tungstate transport system permease protein